MATIFAPSWNVGLRGWWTFDDQPIDSSGGGNNIIATGSAVTRGTGRVISADGKCGSYKCAGGDYTNDGVRLNPTTITADILSNPFSIAAWIKTPGTATRGCIFCNSSSAGVLSLAITVWTSKIGVWKSNAGPVLLSTNNVDDDNWHHVAITSGTDTRIYLDGPLNCTPTTAFSTQTLYELWIGNLAKYANNAYAFDGEIDDVRFYCRELSPQDVYTIYNEAFQPIERELQEMPTLRLSLAQWQLYFSRNSGAYEPVTTTSIGVKSADASTDADETKILIPRL